MRVRCTANAAKAHRVGQYGAWKRFLPAQDGVVDHPEMPADDVSHALLRLTEAVRAATPPG
jgi:hypothetical protein